MTNSRKARSRIAERPATREELADLFWHAGGMDHFAKGCADDVRIPWHPPLSYAELSEFAFGEGERSITADYYTYRLEIFNLYDSEFHHSEQWIAITCRGMIVVAPFLRPLVYSEWPCYPEDIDRV